MQYFLLKIRISLQKYGLNLVSCQILDFPHENLFLGFFSRLCRSEDHIRPFPISCFLKASVKGKLHGGRKSTRGGIFVFSQKPYFMNSFSKRRDVDLLIASSIYENQSVCCARVTTSRNVSARKPNQGSDERCFFGFADKFVHDRLMRNEAILQCSPEAKTLSVSLQCFCLFARSRPWGCAVLWQFYCDALPPGQGLLVP